MFKIILGIVIGAMIVYWLMKRVRAEADAKFANPNAEAIGKKRENLQKVLELARSRVEISNDDVEKTLGVSDATATNYLSELEKQGKLVQVGTTGQAVRYRVK